MKSAASKDQAIAANSALKALRDILTHQEPVICAPGDILMRQGEPSDKAFLLEEGSVLVYAETSYGAVPLATLEAPRLIGEIGVFANIPRTASVRAVRSAKVLPISKAALLEFGEKSPALLFAVIEQLGRQIDSVNRAVSLYTNAISALEKREFDPQILDDLKNPIPQLQDFAAAFRRFADQILDKRRQHDEMASAALIQRSLLPKPSAADPVSGFVELHAEMHPARHVGGDFYDFFMMGEDRLAIAIGDVCGKGIAASLFMAIAVTVLRIAAREETDVASIVTRTNAILCLENASSMFATLFFGVLNARTGVLEYANCGHNPPLFIPEREEPRALPGGGLPIALFPDRATQVQRVTLDAGDRLLLFTDGVTEATGASGVEFGDSRLHAVIARSRELTARDLVLAIISKVEGFVGGSEQSDDITCLAISRSAGPQAIP